MVTFCVVDPSMKRHLAVGVAVVGLAFLVGCTALGLRAKAPSKKHIVTADVRLAAIRQACVWAPTNVPAMDLRVGPKGSGAFFPNATLTCDYLDKPMSGSSPKFACVLPPNDELKVKYGRAN